MALDAAEIEAPSGWVGLDGKIALRAGISGGRAGRGMGRGVGAKGVGWDFLETVIHMVLWGVVGFLCDWGFR